MPKTLNEVASDPKIIETLTKYEQDKGEFGDSPVETVRNFLSDYRFLQSNTYGAYDFINYVNSIEDEEYKKNLGEVYNIIDNELESQITGEDVEFGERARGVGEYLLYTVTDPLNILGAGVGGRVANTIARPVINKLITGALGRKVGASAAGAAAIDAPISAIQETSIQTAEKDLDVRDDYSVGEIAGAAAIGGVTSGAIGAGFSLIGHGLGKITGGSYLEKATEQLENTVQGKAAKKPSLKNSGAEELEGLYVNLKADTPKDFLEDYDPMGRIIGAKEVTDGPNVVTVEFLQKTRGVGKSRIQKQFTVDEISAVSERTKLKNVAEYREKFEPDQKNRGFFDQDKINEGDELIYKSASKLGLSEEDTASVITNRKALLSDLKTLAPDEAGEQSLLNQVDTFLFDLLKTPDGTPSPLLNSVDLRSSTSEAISKILETVDPSQVGTKLNQALDASKLTMEEFAKIYRFSISEVGASLGSKGKFGKGVLGQFGNRVGKITPEDRDWVISQREISDRSKQVASKFGFAVDTWRSFIVMQPATTARNIAGSMAQVPGLTLRKFIDGFLINWDRKVQGLEGQNLEVKWWKNLQTSGEIAKRVASPDDSIQLMKIFAENNKEVRDTILNVFDDRLRLPSDLGEGDGAIVRAFTHASRIGNVLNAAQDRAFKSAAFLTELNHQVMLKKRRGDPAFANINSVEEIIGLRKFDLVDDAMYSKAIQAAYNITYQSKNAGDKLAYGGSVINYFQEMASKSNVIKVIGVPFPNFLMNSFVYTLNRMGGAPIKLGKSLIGDPLSPKEYRSVLQRRKEAPAKRKELNQLEKSLQNYDRTSKIDATLQKFKDKDGKFLREAVEKEVQSLRTYFVEGEKVLNDFRDSLVETAEAISLLGVALALRTSENAGSQWWEMKTASGESYDLRPFFPLAPFLFLADSVLNYIDHPNATRSPSAVEEGLQAITGLDTRAGLLKGTGNFWNNIQSFADSEDPEGAQKIGAIVGATIGKFLGGFVTPLRAFDDLSATVIEGGQRPILDRNQEKNLLLKMGIFDETDISTSDLKGVLNGFVTEMVKEVTRGTVAEQAIFADTTPEKASPFSGEIGVRPPRVAAAKQFTGARMLGTKSNIENEVSKQGIKLWELAPKSEVPAYKNAVINVMGYISDKIGDAFISSPRYQNASPEDKKRLLENLYTGSEREDPDVRAFLRARGLPGDITSIQSMAKAVVERNQPILYKFHDLKRLYSKSDEDLLARYLSDPRYKKTAEFVYKNLRSPKFTGEGSEDTEKTIDFLKGLKDKLTSEFDVSSDITSAILDMRLPL